MKILTNPLFTPTMRVGMLSAAFVLIAGRLASAQGTELKGQVSSLAQTIQSVQSGSKSYDQHVEFVEPAVVRYTYDETDQKGNKTSYAVEFNLADIDPYAVREQTQKDVITVNVVARNKEKLIKVYKNEVVQPYDAEIAIRAKDIDNGRAIADIIKKAIPLAEKVMANRLKLSGYNAMADWLVGNVKEVNFGDKSVSQSMTKGEHPGTFVFTRVEKDAKSSSEEVVGFNLADINPNAVVYKITGNQFAISVEAPQKQKYFALRKDGAVKPYTNSFVISTNNADEARDLKHVLTTAIPLAEKEVKASMPSASSDKDALSKLAALVTTITYGEKEITQAAEGGCLTTFTQVEKTAKASSKNEQKFNWMDVNPLASKMDVSGEKVFIDLHFAGDKKLVMVTTDAGFKGYDNAATLYLPDIESARRAKVLLDLAVEKCKASYKEPFGNDAASTTSYFRSNIKDLVVDDMTLKQSIEPVEDGNNKFKYTAIEVTPKGSGGEEVYEFNLSDINPSSITTDVKGKWLYVVMETNLKSKIIKAYKDGKIQPYASSLTIAVNDVDVARNLVSALGKAVKALKAK
jgi:hypothetical protein